MRWGAVIGSVILAFVLGTQLDITQGLRIDERGETEASAQIAPVRNVTVDSGNAEVSDDRTGGSVDRAVVWFGGGATVICIVMLVVTVRSRSRKIR